MKYLKAFLIVLLTTILVNILFSSLCYFDIIGNTTNSVLKILSILIFSFISGLYIGIKSSNKGYLEGIKVGLITILFMILLSYLGFNDNFNMIKILYYFLILLVTIIGSVIGINKKEKK